MILLRVGAALRDDRDGDEVSEERSPGLAQMYDERLRVWRLDRLDVCLRAAGIEDSSSNENLTYVLHASLPGGADRTLVRKAQ